MKFILGKKLSMTQIWSGDEVLALTPVAAGPCVITQVKTKAKDGYESLQLAYGERQVKNIKKPQLGHYKKADVKPTHVREFRIDTALNFKAGDVVTAETFAVGDKIDVTGTSKGRGFQGVVKRHHFHGFRKTHGNKDQERMPGSIGPKGPAHVFKGTRMGGRMGGVKVTTTNLEVAAIDAVNNILFIKGAVPGAINDLVIIKGEGNLQVNLRKNIAPEVTPEAINEPEVTSEAAQTVSEAPRETAATIKEDVKEAVKKDVKEAV